MLYVTVGELIAYTRIRTSKRPLLQREKLETLMETLLIKLQKHYADGTEKQFFLVGI